MVMRLRFCVLLLLIADAAAAEVVRIDVTRRDDAGTHERVIARVHFAVNPNNAANRRIADIDAAPRNAAGQVEFAGDLLMFIPKDGTRTRGTVFLEVPNRGRDQSLALLSGAQQQDLAPEAWVLGDRFLLEQGFTVAFLGWQFDVNARQGLTFAAPLAQVEGLVRESYVEPGLPERIGGVPPAPGRRSIRFPLTYCAAPGPQEAAVLTFRTRIDGAPTPLPRDAWTFTADRCGVQLAEGLGVGLYEAVYTAAGSPVAGLGLAAIRDFASYLRHAPARMPLRERPAAMQRVIGYGYSQSARLLREFVRDGFNADERGRAAFDGLMISSAGAGGGSFNHRFAVPGHAGNSVLSVLRPVDLPPFTDDGLLASARSSGVTPKIVYTFSSTEYWARAGSLTHTTADGTADDPLAATSRLYFLAGTPHSSGALPLAAAFRSGRSFQHYTNFAEQRWVSRALLINLDEWIRDGTEPPPSRYPSLARDELVAFDDVHFPAMGSFRAPRYMPQVWRMDYGSDYPRTRIITEEPPRLGTTFRVLVPQVNADGNDLGGIAMPEIAVPLGTYTGWNVEFPGLQSLGYLAGLVGSFQPFAATQRERHATGDTRRSIEERYASRNDYLDQVKRAAEGLVRERLLLADDIPAVLRRADGIWSAVVDTKRNVTTP
jgi:hypothetical protein